MSHPVAYKEWQSNYNTFLNPAQCIIAIGNRLFRNWPCFFFLNEDIGGSKKYKLVYYKTDT